LEAQRYEVLEATNGKMGLEVLKDHPDIKLIITDYNMPVMDGFGLVSQVRKRYNKDQIAIIGLSSEGGKLLSAKFLKLGANDFLPKPFASEEFYARVTQNIEMLELIEELKNIAIRDPLTRLYNRRYCFDAGRKLFEECRSRNAPLCVVLIDIDFFKRINDTFGHDAGDEALKHLAGILQNAAGKSYTVSRLGGEEFCMLSGGLDRESAEVFFENLRSMIEETQIEYKGKNISFTISTGISTGLLASLEDMINCADEMLYRAKREGRNRVVFSQ
jgi:diguanylate cyclase (GGDEF)-like protein